MSEIKIAIIGSRDLQNTLPFEELVERVKKEIESHKNVILISGGSSWADFIAVYLFYLYPELVSKLILYLPCNFDATGFVACDGDGGAAKTLNILYKEFETHTKINSINIMNKVNAEYHVVPGFLPRNDEIAKNCDIVIALSRGITQPDSKGTLYTWNKCINKKRIHISLLATLKN